MSAYVSSPTGMRSAYRATAMASQSRTSAWRPCPSSTATSARRTARSLSPTNRTTWARRRRGAKHSERHSSTQPSGCCCPGRHSAATTIRFPVSAMTTRAAPLQTSPTAARRRSRTGSVERSPSSSVTVTCAGPTAGSSSRRASSIASTSARAASAIAPPSARSWTMASPA